MNSKDDYRILLIRNEVSFCLDDLTALVVNSALANQLRELSSEIMGLTPGFVLTLKQAKSLKKLTQTTLDQYRKKAIDDMALMSFQTNARTILDGETIKTGGNQMGIFDSIVHRKEIKRRTAIAKTEQNYKETCQKITDCQKEMKRCIENGRGLAPDSAIYHQNERAYNNAKNKLTLLKKQELSLRKILEDADQFDLIQQFAESQKALAASLSTIVGSDKARAELLATVDIQTESIDSTIDKLDGYGASIFETSENAVTNSEYGAQVAAAERRHAESELSGIPMDKNAQDEGEINSEYGALVKASDSPTE